MSEPAERAYVCRRALGNFPRFREDTDCMCKSKENVCVIDSKPCIIWEYKLIGPMPEVKKGEGE